MKERQIKVVDRSVLKQGKNDKEEKKILEADDKNRETEQTKQPHIHKSKKRANGKQILIGVVVFILLLLAAFKIYVDNDYKPLHSMEDYQSMIRREIEKSDNAIAIQNEEAIAQKKAIGFIIYGDERVNRECYLPLMIALADQGFCVYLPTTFGNLPVLNQEAAEYAIRTYTTVKTWYIIAHGKACQTAARYVKTHSDKIAGMVYLGGASYQTDLSGLDLDLLSVLGSKDTVIDMEKMQTAKANDPSNTQYVSIEGGNHTGFLDAALMRGDSLSHITADEQIKQTVSAINTFVKKQ